MKFHTFPPVAAIVVAGLLSIPVTLLGQSSNASISGVVTDSSGATVPGADLVLEATDSAKVSKVNSGPDGLFAFPNLQAGNYQLKVSAKGFKDFVQTGIVLHLNDSVTLPVSLQVGEASQTIEVNANASPLNFENAEVKGTITKREILSLPLAGSGRAALCRQLCRLVARREHRQLSIEHGHGSIQRRAGTFRRGNAGWHHDARGLAQSERHDCHSSRLPDLAGSGRRNQCLTSNYDVQYGASGAAVIVASTKEGTNELHGGGYEFHRNNFFNARPWNALKTPRDLENDYGGYVGGPGKLPGLWTSFNKTYFFVNYEQYRSVGATTQPVLTVPTAKMRAGDFSEWPQPIYDPATTTLNPNYNPNAATGANNLPYSAPTVHGLRRPAS